MQRQDLERMTREQLIAHAERLGIPRPRVLTQPELIDEIIGRTTNDRERVRARGWLGRARDLLAKVVEKGLHLPEAARVLRQEQNSWPAPPPPLPTVTLAEIYAAQGHLERAISVLDEVLTREPDHREARSLRERFVEQRERARARAGRIETPPAPPPSAREPKSAKPKEAAPKAAEVKAKPDDVSGPPTMPQGAKEAAPITSPAVEAEAKAQIEAPAETAPEAIAAEAAEAVDAIASTERAPGEPIEEPPLPSRYEVDEVVAIAVDPRTIYIYWEVRATTLARARAANPEGQMCLRIASVTASWEGPVVDTRDLHVDALYGDRFLRDVQPGSNVRASLGWKSAAGFEPLAVGAEVTAPRAVPAESVAEDVARWEEGPAAPFAAWGGRAEEPRSTALRAVEEHAIDPFISRRAAIAPWSQGTASPNSVHAAPVDTGFAVWGEPVAGPGEEISEREVVVEEPWFVAGGSSELSRGGPGRTRTIRVSRQVAGPPARFGGASDLHRGGASELGR